MDPNRWDWIDWLKAIGYAVAGGGLILSFLGDRRAAGTLQGVSALLGVAGGFVDLVEPPKHCGVRAIPNQQLGCHVCPKCGYQVPNTPQFGFPD